ERAAVVIAGVAAQLARQLAMGRHPGRVEPMVCVGLLPDRVEPRERGAARPAAGRTGIERQHARAGPGGRLDGRDAHDPESHDRDVVIHRRPPVLAAPALRAHYRVPRARATYSSSRASSRPHTDHVRREVKAKALALAPVTTARQEEQNAL